MRKLYTTYFANLKNAINPISIAGKAPDFYHGPEYKKLAPKYYWWKKWHDEKLSNEWYIKQYNRTVLQKLDATKTVNELFDLYPGEEIITLLCFEKDSFCHRHLCTAWIDIEQVKDVECKELRREISDDPSKNPLTN
jgi:hypothetical protein